MNSVVPIPMTTYRVTEWDGTPVEGQFYEGDLQPMKVPDDALFRMEKDFALAWFPGQSQMDGVA